MPRVPDHIIVTFDGQTREIMRIVREEDDEERRARPARKTSEKNFAYERTLKEYFFLGLEFQALESRFELALTQGKTLRLLESWGLRPGGFIAR
jgi:hypothetical protein